MKILSYIFTVIKIFGFWCPLEWSSGWKNDLYWTYTLIVISLMCTMYFTQIMYLLKFIENIEEFANIAFLLFTELCTLSKVLNILGKRRDIIQFTNILTNESCIPNCTEEIMIQNNFDRRIRRNTMLYGAMVQFTIVVVTVTAIFENVPERTLPFNAWIPFNYKTSIGFWAAFLHQLITYFLHATAACASDTLITGFMSQACAQLNILKYRFKLIPSTFLDEAGDHNALKVEHSIEKAERKALEKCIRHHHNIFEFTNLLNEAFDGVLFMQCAISSFVLCISIFIFSRMKPFSPEFSSLALYIFCMFVQIFIFCWFGNELIVESMDVGNAVYTMDWTKLNVRTQKSLIIVMVRTLRPIKFTSFNIITLYLETFRTLIKLSYSMFNLLDQTS